MKVRKFKNLSTYVATYYNQVFFFKMRNFAKMRK
jgi:hypothetical protein